MKSSLKPERLLLARCPRVEWEVLDYAARTSFQLLAVPEWSISLCCIICSNFYIDEMLL
jgi:hypothetical protein